MDKKFLISVGVSVLALIIAIYNYTNKPKMGYVVSAQILLEYAGVKEGKSIYEEKAKTYQTNIEALKGDFTTAVNAYQQEYKTLSKEQRVQKEQVLARQEKEVKNYILKMEQKIKEEDQELSKQVLNQIDSYIIEYGKQEGYDYIFGSNDQNNLFYAKEADDLTEEILKGLNSTYSGNLIKTEK